MGNLEIYWMDFGCLSVDIRVLLFYNCYYKDDLYFKGGLYDCSGDEGE